MCGIFGVIQKNGRPPDEHLLSNAATALRHRGPDGSGVYQDGPLGLVHTRLALLDLSERGNQPFWDPSRRYCIIFNGEIYNFRSLRSDLERDGIRFCSGTDTEAILHALILYGVDSTLARLRGMFAFAFFDRVERQLVLARDRFGIKPLVVYEDDNLFLFGSEVRAFKPFVRLQPDRLAPFSYLLGFGGPMQAGSFYEGVRFVPPGTVIECRLPQESRWRSFTRVSDDLDPGRSTLPERLDDRTVTDLVDAQLQTAVDQMLVADARVGGLCSGGVDSSLVLAMANKRHDDLAIFHANVVGRSSEYPAARRLAEHLRLELHSVDVHDSDFVDQLPDVIRHYEQPFSYHPNSIPFLMVSRLVRQSGVKAVVCGEGADECFLGYSWLAREPFEVRRRRVAESFERLVRSSSLGRVLLPKVDDSTALLRGVLSGFEREAEEDGQTEEYNRRFPQAGPRDARTLHLLGYHLRTLLHRNDRLGMAASIEARFPFLDESVVTTAIQLPRKYKIRSGFAWRERSHPFVSTKWVVRSVADRYLPRHLSRRPKIGFPVTAFDRMRITPEFFDDSYVSSSLRMRRQDVARVLKTEDRLCANRLLMLDAWGRLCLEDEDPETYRSRLKQHASFLPEERA